MGFYIKLTKRKCYLYNTNEIEYLYKVRNYDNKKVRKDERREKIIDVAFRLFVDKKKIESVTMEK